VIKKLITISLNYILLFLSFLMLTSNSLALSMNIKYMLANIPYNNRDLIRCLSNYNLSTLDSAANNKYALLLENTQKKDRFIQNLQIFLTIGASYSDTDCSNYYCRYKGSTLFTDIFNFNFGLSIINSKYATFNLKLGPGLAINFLNLYKYSLPNETTINASIILNNPSLEANLLSINILENIGAELNFFLDPISLNLEGGYLYQFYKSDWVFKDKIIDGIPNVDINEVYFGTGIGFNFK